MPRCGSPRPNAWSPIRPALGEGESDLADAVARGADLFGSLTRLDWGAWVYSTIGPLLVTNWLYFRALHRVGAARATLYMYLQPFLGAVFAAWLLGGRTSSRFS